MSERMDENCEDDSAVATSCSVNDETASSASYALKNILDLEVDNNNKDSDLNDVTEELERVDKSDSDGENSSYKAEIKECIQDERDEVCQDSERKEEEEEREYETCVNEVSDINDEVLRDDEVEDNSLHLAQTAPSDSTDYESNVEQPNVNGNNVDYSQDISGSQYVVKSNNTDQNSDAKDNMNEPPKYDPEPTTEGESQPPTLEPLPECRNKRSYVCGFCNMKTNNPREYLYHLKDTHGENIRIFECSRCIYASKTHQKLVRHNHMVHKVDLNPEGSEQKRKNKEKDFKPSNKKIKTSPISNRSPRESKSPRRFEEYEFINDNELDYDETLVSAKSTAGKPLYHCNQCKFSTFSTKVLAKHENKYHLKRRFYKCTRCNYATQVKARYTKHMKYHQLPIIKCDWCDFRTPYRWNLDRHTKNHTEEIGEHRCHLCNFTAQIKQSLTVHVANHHLTPEQIKEKESRRIIGVCDPEDCLEEDELELLRMERDEDPDALELPYPSMVSPNQSFTVSNIDMGSQDDFESSVNGSEDNMNADELKRKKPKIKITLKKMKPPKDTFFQELNERHNFEDDFIHPDDVVHRHGNVYIKTEKCNLCSFKAPFQYEIERHQRKAHGLQVLKGEESLKKSKKNKSDKSDSSDNSSDSLSEGEKRKYSPNSISNDVNSNFIEEKSDTEINNDSNVNEKDDTEKAANMKEGDLSGKDSTPVKKKSFFDKLQEKLSSSNVQNLVCQFCGHESKCLSESVRHQKLHLSAKNLCTTPSLSTRCQFCRHRCKTTDDLINHLKLCPEARKNQISDNMINEISDEILDENKETKSISSNDEDRMSSEADRKHPMENKVFVWNNISSYNEEEAETVDNEGEENSNDGRSETHSENASSLPDSENLEDPQFTNGETYKIKRVYRCPQCKFWAATASRFHIHIIGHYNTKPYRCSECGYRSNWRWDITKHIKLKIPKDINHQNAEPRLVNENGEKNYDKYEKYLVEVRMDGKPTGSRGEGGGTANTKRGRHKRAPDNDGTETDSSKSSPCPTPLTVPLAPTSTSTPSTGPSTSKFPAPPKLMRAPNRQFTSSPGPNPFGPINPGAQMMVEMGSANPSSESDASKKKLPMKPPPLVAMGAFAQQQKNQQHQQQSQVLMQQQQQLNSQHQESPSSLHLSKDDVETATQDSGNSSKDAATSSSSNYQIITPQGALHTSLETLQLLAAGSTNLAKLKRQQKETGEGKNPELDAAVANQMRLILWLNCLAREAEQKDTETGNTGDPPISSIMQLVLDHEGNPEWKCLNCDFRDNEQETVVQHVRLAHGKKGPVSLLHAVHRCSVCGFAAGTKRHVQVHLETAHNGQGGIISRSEGQNIDPENRGEESSRSFDCRLCPYTCKKRGELKTHLSHHTPRVDYVFKCMFCPYYVATKSELFNHLSVHGMDIPAPSKDANSGGASAPIPTMINSTPTEEPSARHFVCDLCPFETRSRAKLMHHRQFHRPRGLPFSCSHCSYNVTRRHLLAQHLRIHGVSPTDSMEGLENQGSSKSTLSKMLSDDSSFSRSKSPSPSLTITPISSAKEGDSAPPKIDPNCLPTLSDELTKNLHDIPLVWVSRDNRFFKMFKCRHCPHVNLRKTNIQEHEKMHRSDGLVPGTGHACQFCSYICINAGVMSAHLKVHSGSMGKCHAIVDQALPNEEQLHMLAGSAMKKAMGGRMVSKGDEKLLYYCQTCPGRFFFEKEVQIHSRFHISNTHYTHHCSKCSFGARDESQILAHAKVHTPEYQERTRTLMSMHPSSPSFPPVPGLSVPQEAMNKSPLGLPLMDNSAGGSSKGVSVNGFSRPGVSSPAPLNSKTGNLPQPPPTSRFKCDQCPSTFSKLITLQYHQSLHSADNPFRCNRCSYAAKTQDGLQQHTALHEQADMEKNSTGSFLSSSPSPAPSPSPSLSSSKKSLEETLGVLTGKKQKKALIGPVQDSAEHPPIKLKFIGLKGASSSGSSKKQFKYYIEEQVPLSGVELLKRKNQIEREMPKDAYKAQKIEGVATVNKRNFRSEDRTGNPKLHYPLHIDKSSGRSREKRYKCSHCPSAFEKSDQFNVHLNLHGSNYKYKCRICDYSVKFYANFMMHIKRHKYHERMDAQKKGLPPPLEDQEKYEPYIGENMTTEDRDSRDREELLGDKENQIDFDAYPDMTTAEKQQLILQQKKADAFKSRDEDKDRRIYYCQYCPYANMRRDAVDSHSLRHQANMGRGLYQCNFCDYTASQPNFIREHTKVHFRPFKYVLPEGFMRHDKLEIWSIKPGETTEEDEPKKALVFGHEEGLFTPDLKKEENEKESNVECKEAEEESEENVIDSQVESGILVDFRSGDVVEAPASFIIPIRPKSKATTLSNGNGTNSTKHKSNKCMKARKKTKTGSSIMPESEDCRNYNVIITEEDKKSELNDLQPNALSNQESLNNSPHNSLSSSNNEAGGEFNTETLNDGMNVNIGNFQDGGENVSNIIGNFVPSSAVSH